MPQEPQNPLHNPPFAGRILGPDGREFDIPPEGTLGVLALGATGLLAWRKRRGTIESSFVKAEPPKQGADGKDQGKGKGRRRRQPAATPQGKDAADGPQAGQ